MIPSVFIFYTRQGCCLCEGLGKRLKSLPLHQLNPPLKLRIIDIDRDGLSKDEYDRYNLEVPVLALGSSELKQLLQLPRVSPRLSNDGLFNWLQKFILKNSGVVEENSANELD